MKAPLAQFVSSCRALTFKADPNLRLLRTYNLRDIGIDAQFRLSDFVFMGLIGGREKTAIYQFKSLSKILLGLAAIRLILFFCQAYQLIQDLRFKTSGEAKP
jgi:hypothetical protein